MLSQTRCHTSGAMQGTTTRMEATCSTCQSSSRISSTNVWPRQRVKSTNPSNQRSSSTPRDRNLYSTSAQRLRQLQRAPSPTRTPTGHLPHLTQGQGAVLLRHDQPLKFPQRPKQQPLLHQVQAPPQQQSRRRRPSLPRPHSLQSVHKALRQTSSRAQDQEPPIRCLHHRLCAASVAVLILQCCPTSLTSRNTSRRQLLPTSILAKSLSRKPFCPVLPSQHILNSTFQSLFASMFLPPSTLLNSR